MKHLGKFFLAIVTLSLLSSGISSAAFAAAEPISVTTNKEWYGHGSTIIIAGEVKDFDPSDPMYATDVTVSYWHQTEILYQLLKYHLALMEVIPPQLRLLV